MGILTLWDIDGTMVNVFKYHTLAYKNAIKKVFDVSLLPSELEVNYGYFGIDYESYMRTNIQDYQSKETAINSGKVINAKIISEQNNDIKPAFIDIIAMKLNLVKEE